MSVRKVCFHSGPADDTKAEALTKIAAWAACKCCPGAQLGELTNSRAGELTNSWRHFLRYFLFRKDVWSKEGDEGKVRKSQCQDKPSPNHFNKPIRSHGNKSFLLDLL